MNSVFLMSIKKLEEGEEDVGRTSRVGTAPNITDTDVENGDDGSGRGDYGSGSISGGDGGGSESGGSGVGVDIGSISHPSSADAGGNSEVETTEKSSLQDGKTSLYGGVDSTSTKVADGMGQIHGSVTGVSVGGSDGDSGSDGGDGDGGGGSGGIDNPSFDLSPETTDSKQNPQQPSDNTKTATEDTESKQSFIYPNIGNGLKNGKAGEPAYDVTDCDHGADTVPCGVGGCHPSCLQRFRTIGCFAFSYGLTGIVTSALSIYIGSQVTTLEKHFNFNSSVSGFLMSCNDFGYFLTCLFLSYFTRRIHIPRCLAIATVLYGLSGLVCTIPYFGTRDKLTIDHMNHGNNSNASVEDSPGQMCVRATNGSSGSNSCHGATSGGGGGGGSDSGGGIHGVSENWRNLAIMFIAVGMLIQGIAKSPRQSFVSVYIDDNGPKTKSTLYLGIISGLAIFGPSLAFIMGGLFSSMYITLEDTDMSTSDPRWLGAWWIGFMVFGTTSLVIGIPLLFFPKKIIVKPEIEAVERKRKMKGQGQSKLKVELKGFFVALLKLLMNPLYVMLVVGSGLNYMGVSGLMAFAPKYLEVHFNQATWTVNIVLGAMTVGGAAIGSVGGGVITSRYRLSPRTCLKLAICLLSLGLCVQMGAFLIKCDQPVISTGFDDGGAMGSQCTTSCRCNDISFFPVCGDDGHNYFSPCHAGCTHIMDSGRTFSNCSCLASPHVTKAKGGLCDSGCDSKFWLYASLSVFSSLSLTFSIMPTFVAIVRSVPEDQKPMALGISSFLSTLIGWFPGPIVYGMIVDTTCLITQSSPCGEEVNKDGACLLYDLTSFRNKYHGAIAILRLSCIILYSCGFLYVKFSSKPTFVGHDDENDDNDIKDEKKGTGSNGIGGGGDKNKKKKDHTLTITAKPTGTSGLSDISNKNK